MSIIRKNIYLISCFVVTAIVAVFNLLSSSYVSSTIFETLDALHGKDAYYTDWNVAIIIIISALVLFAVVSLLFSVPQKDNEINKKVQIVLLVLNIVMTILTIFFICFVAFRINRYNNMLFDGEDLAIRDSSNYLSDTSYSQCFWATLIACISNIIMSTISCIGNNEQENIEVCEDNDENKLVKDEIQKLKKQLELEDLKTEYATLYNKLNKEKTQTSKSEDTKISNNK